MSLIIGFKILIVPSLIAAVTLAGRRWGPAVAGWLSGFPIVTGPILFFIAYEQGPAFGSATALGTLLGIPTLLAFNVTYAWSATRTAWPLSLSAALTAYGVVAAALLALELSAPALAMLAAILLIAGPYLFPHVADTATPVRPNSRNEILYRMLAAAMLVLLVTYFATTLGARLSGLFAMFPVISIVLASFSHHHAGAGFVTRLLRSVILGWYALVVFCYLLYLMLPLLQVGLAFFGATSGAIAVQLISRRFIRR